MLLHELPDRPAEAPAPRVAIPPIAGDAVLALDGAGIIWDCTAGLEALVKCRRGELIGRHISVLVPELEGAKLVRGGQLSPRLHLLSHMGRTFRVVARDGRQLELGLSFNRLGNSWSATLLLRPGTRAAPRRFAGRHRSWNAYTAPGFRARTVARSCRRRRIGRSGRIGACA